MRALDGELKDYFRSVSLRPLRQELLQRTDASIFQDPTTTVTVRGMEANVTAVLSFLGLTSRRERGCPQPPCDGAASNTNP